MKNLSIKIFDLKKQYEQLSKEIEKDVKDPRTVNNSLFIGSTKELQDLLLEKNNGKR